eukprot:CAMPEP_0114503860 /NCGR_PEP_ID=MMETSP0109-20121206/9880_1 /TAXON_ID=29199 /ORGANISM="Chlorarachnion reptans, Strain CCCM449" /LENGTH=81 /DNA_ID=CAMNT_0001681931 /DNA_START=740 /DNA_END=982 /DNA_ORIENTATION=+
MPTRPRRSPPGQEAPGSTASGSSPQEPTRSYTLARAPPRQIRNTPHRSDAGPWLSEGFVLYPVGREVHPASRPGASPTRPR